MNTFTKKLLLVVFALTVQLASIAQVPPHPNGGKIPGSAGTNNAPVGGGAPVGNGMFILIVLAAAYSGYKVYKYDPLANVNGEIAE